MRATYSLTHLADSTLIQKLAALVAQDFSTTAELLAHIVEFDARRLYRPAGYPSTFAYCVDVLHLSDDATAKRIHAGRAARRFPVLFELLVQGELHLTAIRLLAPHLTQSNAHELIDAARHKSNSQIEEMLAVRFPRPDVPAIVRPLPGSTPRQTCGPVVGSGASTMHLSSQHAPGHVEIDNALSAGNLEFASTGNNVSFATDRRAPIDASAPVDAPNPSGPGACAAPDAAPAAGSPLSALHGVGQVPRDRTTPLSADRFGVQFTIDRETYVMLRYAQELLGHSVSFGDLAGVFKQSLKALIAEREKRKFAATDQPRRRYARTSKPGEKSPRTIPAPVKRAVWERDRGQCTFVAANGRRCSSRAQIEFDHIEPITRGGTSSVSNLRLRCRAHNQYEAECLLGAGFMERKREHALRRITESNARGRGFITDHDAFQ